MELSLHETKRERNGEKRQKQRKMGLLEKRADQTETGNEREDGERKRVDDTADRTKEDSVFPEDTARRSKIQTAHKV